MLENTSAIFYYKNYHLSRLHVFKKMDYWSKKLNKLTLHVLPLFKHIEMVHKVYQKNIRKLNNRDGSKSR